MKYQIRTEGEFTYLDTESTGSVLMLLHGLFGQMSNFTGIIEQFGESHRVVVPILPIYEMPLRRATVTGLKEYVTRFVEWKDYTQIHLLGNSLGGHVGLLYALSQPERIRSITLTGSSGLFENALGSSFPRRSNKDFVRERTQAVFYDPATASEEMVDEVYDIVNDRNKALRLITMAKSAIRENLSNRLDGIRVPTLLVWGKQDTITPSFVAEQFAELIAQSEVEYFDQCGHAPMMEHPEQFNAVLQRFLEKVDSSSVVV